MNAGRLSEETRVPAQVDDIIVLTEILPCNPENTYRAQTLSVNSISMKNMSLTATHTTNYIKTAQKSRVKDELMNELIRLTV